MPSARYKQLRERVEVLRTRYIPAADPLGHYPPEVQDDIRAFLVLAHGEIEYFLEQTTFSVAVESIRAWKNKLMRIPVVGMLAFNAGDWPAIPNASDRNPTTKYLESPTERLEQAAKKLMGAIKANHGVKEKNALYLLCSIGFGRSDIDPALLLALEQFGERRGAVAHVSGLVAVTLDPVVELRDVNAILDMLKDVDEKCIALSGQEAGEPEPTDYHTSMNAIFE